MKKTILIAALLSSLALFAEERATVNVVNFVRSLDPRMDREDCNRALAEEVALNLKYGFRNTILFQYDSLLDDEQVALARRSDPEKTEFGVWLELCRPLVEKVGLKWESRRGWDWDWHVNPGFLQAYSQEGRRRIIDEVFAKFKSMFGDYPKSVGSWFIDAYSMDYMVERYGVDGFCICREQDSTDAYGLRGGYSNGAYYPSKKNMLSAAVDMANAVRAPVFRMLTPDPIYNYDHPERFYPGFCKGDGCLTLEPVWRSGYTPAVVDWYFRTYCDAPGLLNLSYVQIGQENAFGWRKISKGLPLQCERLAGLEKAGKVVVETMGETARRFKREHPRNCAQTQVALEDWKGAGRKSVWYNCATYRANLFLDGNRLQFRDIHVMRDDYAEPYLERVCTNWSASYFTPPVVDLSLAVSNRQFRTIEFPGKYVKLVPEGDGRSRLSVSCVRADGGVLKVEFAEDRLTVRGGEIDWPHLRTGCLQFEFDGYRYAVGCEVDSDRRGFTLRPQGGMRLRVRPTAGDATAAIQGEIDRAFKAGGGTVVVGRGEWNVKSLRVRSRVTLYLESGATIRGSRNPEDYFILDDDAVEPVPRTWITHEAWTLEQSCSLDNFTRYPASRWNNGLIRLLGAEDAAIVGEKGSVIDGCNPFDPIGEEFYRGPQGVSAINCRRLVLRGYTIRQTGNWAHRIADTTDLRVEDVTCEAGHDGVHMNGCDGVVIRNCVIKTGDDCIAGFDNADVLVEGCYLNTACSGFRFAGTDVTIRRCTLKGPAEYGFRGSMSKADKAAGAPSGKAPRNNMLSFFTYYSDGTHPVRRNAGRIVISDCTSDDTDRLLHYNYGNEKWQRGKPMTDIAFDNVKATRIKMPISLWGDREVPVRISLRNCEIGFVAPQPELIRGAYISSVELDNVRVTGGVAGPLVRLWQTDGPKPEVRVDRSHGIGDEVVPAKGPWSVRGI